MAERNYYEVLGVPRTATADEIKKAYRKLVRKYHPDVSKDPDADAKTSEINLAYETLQDKEKRAEYDDALDNPYGRRQASDGNGGFQYDFDPSAFGGGSSSFGNGDFRFEDIFSAFGGAQNGGHRSRRPQGPVPGEDSHAELSIDIATAYLGGARSLSVDMPSYDNDGHPVAERKTLNVKIPKGIAEGQQIRLAGQGHAGYNGGKAGDLYLKIVFHNNPQLHVQNRKDVYIMADIRPWTAALGGKITVSTPGGEQLHVTLPANSSNGRKIRLTGKGIPAKEAGDLYLLLNISLPPCHSDADKAAWQQLADHYAPTDHDPYKAG